MHGRKVQQLLMKIVANTDDLKVLEELKKELVELVGVERAEIFLKDRNIKV